MLVNKTNLMAFPYALEPDEWIKDSGCSKHMTRNRKLFSTYKAYNGGNIIGKGQICDNKCRVTFSEHDSEITKDGKVIVEIDMGNRWSKGAIVFQEHHEGLKEDLFSCLRSKEQVLCFYECAPSVAKETDQPDWKLTNEFIMDKVLYVRALSTTLPLLAHDAALDDGALLMKRCRWIGSIKKSLLRAMRDAVETKKWVVSKGFRYLLEKFKESDLLGAYLGVWISTVITDGMRQGLKAGIVHGRKGTDINFIPAYDPNAAEAYADALNALNNVPFLLLDNLEACAGEKLSYFQALLVIIPYAEYVGALTIELIATEELRTFESDANVLTGTVSEL
ncbi:hypothetical protein Tco_0839818 [Tanacetum coccineum]|uniref:Retrovirus-related Pol polyprotein from transposon TNT 1-94-like beta-barrel domain-containing protein n=1 Tax=Tanacetum coccineum TaxID=301880 RepID=A0ABQ5AW94_9ASTR